MVRDDVRRGGAGATGRGRQRVAPGQPAAEPMTDSTRARGGGGPGAAGGAARPGGPHFPDGAQSLDGAAADLPAPQAAGPTPAPAKDPQGSGQAQQSDGAERPGGGPIPL